VPAQTVAVEPPADAPPPPASAPAPGDAPQEVHQANTVAQHKRDPSYLKDVLKAIQSQSVQVNGNPALSSLA
jgi:hypothetical protein